MPSDVTSKTTNLQPASFACFKECVETPIKNRELIQKAYRKVQQFHVQIRWIASHTDNTSIHYLGNAIADKLSRI